MRSGKVAVTFAVLLVVSFAVMNAMPSDTLPAALLQEAVLALVAFAAVGFAIPDALECCTKSVQQRNTVRFTATALLLAGLVGGAITLLPVVALWRALRLLRCHRLPILWKTCCSC